MPKSSARIGGSGGGSDSRADERGRLGILIAGSRVRSGAPASYFAATLSSSDAQASATSWFASPAPIEAQPSFRTASRCS